MAQDNPEKVEEQTEQTQIPEIKKESKKPSLKIILISIIAILVLLLIIGLSIILFSSKEEPVVEVQEVVQEQIIEEEPEVKFDLSSINSQKLNDQLASLTNKNMKQEEPEITEETQESRRVLEEQKRIEEESLRIEEALVLKQKESLEEKRAELELEVQKLEALKQEAIMAREDLLNAQKTNIEEAKEDTEKEDENTQEKEEPTIKDSGEFLKLINVAKIKGVLYKKYLDKATNIDPNIHLCRDDLNRIELYYGPFESMELRETLLNRLLKNGFSQAYELEMTKDEFDKRCNY